MNKTIYVLSISILLVGCATDEVAIKTQAQQDKIISAPLRALNAVGSTAIAVPFAIIGTAFGMKGAVKGLGRVFKEGWCGEKNEYCDKVIRLDESFPADRKHLVKQILWEYSQLDWAQSPKFRSHRIDEQQLFALQHSYFALIRKVIKNDYALVYNSLNSKDKEALYKVMMAGNPKAGSQHRADAYEIENNDNRGVLLSDEDQKTISNDMGVIGALLLPPHADGVWQHFLNKGNHINEDEIVTANGYNHSVISAIQKNESETGWQYIALRLKYLKDRGASFSNASSSYGW